MARRRLLLRLKPLDVSQSPNQTVCLASPTLRCYITWRTSEGAQGCNKLLSEYLRQKPVEWKPIVRNNLSEPICDVDLVVTVGGDGTLLQGSHFIDDSVPVLGVNSDPTQPEEVEKLRNEFDANRSTDYLCGATVNNFEQADCGKLGEYDSPVLRSSVEELEDYECIGEVPEASWMVTQVPYPPTASRLYWPKSFQNPSDSSTMFVPDICHSQMESHLRSQHNGTVSRHRRQF